MSDFSKKIRDCIGFHFGKGIIFGLFIFLFPVVLYGIAKSTHLIDHKIITKKIMPAIEESFNQEMVITLEQAKAAVNEHAIDKYIANNDLINTSNILNALAKKYDFSGMVAVNKEGVVLARLASPRIGDYVFQTTPWGQSAAKGQSTVMVGEGRNYPFLINGAVPIMKDETVQGALFGSRLLDNQYAQNFKKKYLKPNNEIIFYSNKTGSYGTSFQDSKIQDLQNIYINQGSVVVQQTKSGLLGGHMRINNTIFHALNIKLTDSNGPVGGIIILAPVSTTSTYVVAILMGILLSLLVVVIRRHKHKNNLRRIVLSTIILIITIVGSMAVFSWVINQQIYTLTPPTETIYNSTIAFAPESDIFQLTTQQRISIKIATGGEVINTGQAVVEFDPKAIRIDDILLTNSFCDQGLITEKQIDNKNGKAVITCGKANGFAGNQAVLAELLIQPLKNGTTNLQFGAETKVLANDGLGTNVLRTANNSSYQIFVPGSKEQENKVLLFSYTHPNQTRWYNQKNIHIEWTQPDSYQDYIYTFDKNPDTIPNGTQGISQNNIDLTAGEDGVYYFHIVPRKTNQLGKVTHYKMMIDTTPPGIPEIKSNVTTIKKGESVRLEFYEHGDNLSDLQKNFYVRFNNRIWLPVLPQLDVLFEKGKHSIGLRVFDNAGNFSDTSIEISVN